VGTHTFKAKATDNSNLSGESADVSVSVSGRVVIKYPPTVSLTSPVANSRVTQGAIVTLTAIASDTDGSISKVDFYDNGVLIPSGTVTTAPYSMAYTPTIGAHTFKARATDNESYTAESADVGITVVPYTSPSITLTTPTTGDQFASGASITLGATVTLGDGTITNVKFYDGIVELATDTSAPYTYTYANPIVGEHQLKAKVTDGNGFVVDSNTANVTVTSAPLPPTVSLTATPSAITSGQDTVLSWQVSGATACVSSSNPANVSWDSANKTVPATANTVLTQTISGLSANAQFSLTCTGPGGSTSDSANVTFTAHLPAPNISLTVMIPEGNSYGIAGRNVLLSWTTENVFPNGCTASGSWDGVKANIGVNEVSPELFVPSATYQLTCRGSGGTRSQEVTIEVLGGNRINPDCTAGQTCIKPPDLPADATTGDIDLYVSSGAEGVTDYGKGFKGGLLAVKSNEAYTIQWTASTTLAIGWTCAATTPGVGVPNDLVSALGLSLSNLGVDKTGSVQNITVENKPASAETATPIIKTYSITCTKNAGVAGLFKSLWQLASVGTLAQATAAQTVSDSISVQINPEGVEAVSNPVDASGNCLYLNTATPTTVPKTTSKTFYKKNLVNKNVDSCNAEGQSFMCHAGEVTKNNTLIPAYLDPNQNAYKAYKYASCQESSVEEF
jgi:hypothetical protein